MVLIRLRNRDQCYRHTTEDLNAEIQEVKGNLAIANSIGRGKKKLCLSLHLKVNVDAGSALQTSSLHAIRSKHRGCEIKLKFRAISGTIKSRSEVISLFLMASR